jgi:MFS superfamily sulfate permease-like transporter
MIAHSACRGGDVVQLAPPWLKGYKTEYLTRDIVAGVTLAAIAIPEVMGYTSISQTPIVTGLYTIIFPTIIFGLLCSSRLLVVGADSATAAVLAGGLGALSVSGLTPGSAEWLAWCQLTAIVTGVLLLIARIFKLGFIADFLPASVLIGFLTGVGIQVLSGQIPDMLGIPKGSGNWFEQQWAWISNLGSANLADVGYAALTLAIILGFKRFIPKIPGAIVAIIVTIAISSALDSAANGVKTIGSIDGGFPPIGLPQGVGVSDVVSVLPIAVSCLVLIVAQSAATGRSFAAKHGDRVDVNRDIVGLSGANLAAGLSGTFVVNGSPTKTQILNGNGGKSQVANLVMAGITLLVAMFFTASLAPMPKATLGAIVFLIGVELIDITGMKAILAYRKDEFVVALITAVIVFAVGVEQGIIAALVLAILALLRRQYRPVHYVERLKEDGTLGYSPASTGVQSEPGLLVFRFDSSIYYANATSFVDDVERLMDSAPDKVRMVVLDCSSVDDVDYTASQAVSCLVDYVHQKDGHVALAEADPQLVASFERGGVFDPSKVKRTEVFPTVAAAVESFRSQPAEG